MERIFVVVAAVAFTAAAVLIVAAGAVFVRLDVAGAVRFLRARRMGRAGTKESRAARPRALLERGPGMALRSGLGALLGRGRRLLALVVIAVLALSSTQALYVVQAVVARAEETGADEPVTASYAGRATWDALDEDSPVVAYDAHPADADATGTLVLSRAAIVDYLQGAQAVEDAKDSYVASEEFASRRASELGAKERELDEELASSDASGGGSGLYVADGSITAVGEVECAIAGLEFAVVDPGIAGVMVETDDTGDVLVKVSKAAAPTEVEAIALSFVVTSVSLSYSYGYSYVLQPVEGSGTSGDGTGGETGAVGSGGSADEVGGAGSEAGAVNAGAAGSGAGTSAGAGPADAGAGAADAGIGTEAAEVGAGAGGSEVADSGVIVGTVDVPLAVVDVALGGAARFAEHWGELDLGEAEYNYDGADEGLAYRGPAQTFEMFTASEGLVGSISQEELEALSAYFVPIVKAQDGVYGVELEPRGATSEPRSFTVNWAYPDGEPAGETKVTVSGVETCKIDLGECEVALPFRLANSSGQMDALVAAVNSFVAAKTGGDESGGIADVPAYVAGARIDDLDAYYAAEIADVALEADDYSLTVQTSDENPLLANYTIGGAPQVTIRVMESVSWADSDLRLTKTGLNDNDAITADNWSDVSSWTRAVPTAAWQGHRLSYGAGPLPTSASEYRDSVTLSGGDGKHKDISLYAMDGDEVIRRVTGVSYMLDRQAPVITGASVSSAASAGLAGIFFGGRAIHVGVTLADALPSAGESDGNTVEVAASGLSSVSAVYDDVKSGSSGIASGITGDPSTGIYAFDILGDAEVKRECIHVTATDNAGNVMNSDANTDRGVPVEYARLVADASAPSVSASWSNLDARYGRYYSAGRTLTVEVDDAFFNYIVDYANDQVMFTVSQNGETVLAIRPSDFVEAGAGHWVYVLPFTSDADWVVSDIGVTDIIGRRSNGVAGDSFTIDEAAPAMRVIFDNNDVHNDKYYNAARTATISITERSFSEKLVRVTSSSADVNGEACATASVSGWTCLGDVHTATVRFSGPGAYALSVDGEDLAGNALAPYACPEFIVDTAKPEVRIDGVENLMAYADEVAPSVSIHDTNLDTSSSIQITKVSCPLSPDDENPYALASGAAEPIATNTDMAVAYANPEAIKANDGVYTIAVEAVDLAGNVESRAVTWSVNRYGSTYVVSDVTAQMANRYLRSADLVDVAVTEINPSGLDETKTAVELVRDTQSATLVHNEHYTVGESASTGWHEYIYTVDKANYEGRDGVYRVLFHSQDVAGNLSENTMADKNAEVKGSAAEVNFAVDDTKPIAGFVDLASGGRYEEAGHIAKVTFEDNLKLDHALIKVNGQIYDELDAGQLEASATHEIRLAESDELQSVTVVVYDAAGNVSDELVADNLLVTTNPIAPWLAITPLLVAVIASVAAVMGGSLRLILGRRKKGERAK